MKIAKTSKKRQCVMFTRKRQCVMYVDAALRRFQRERSRFPDRIYMAILMGLICLVTNRRNPGRLCPSKFNRAVYRRDLTESRLLVVSVCRQWSLPQSLNILCYLPEVSLTYLQMQSQHELPSIKRTLVPSR